MNNLHTDTLPWYRQFWPWFILSIPLATIIACSITIWIAVNNDISMVSDDYYSEGIKINDRLQREQATQAANINANILFSQDPLQVSVFLRGDVPENMSKLTLSLSSVSDSSKDRIIRLSSENGRLFLSTIEAEIEGRFYLTLEPEDRSWHLKQEIRLPNASPFLIE